MHKVARRAGRLYDQVTKERSVTFSTYAARSHSDWNPDDSNHSEKATALRTSTLADQKLSDEAAESTEAPRAGSRRTGRHIRRAVDPPKPPPLPSWFLQHNVKLQSVDKDPKSAIVEDLLKHIDEGGQDVSDHEAAASEREQRVNTASSSWSSLNIADTIQFQLETIIKAVFVTAGQDTSRYSHATSGLSLVCPDHAAHSFLTEYVERLAQNTQADVVVVDANDLAECLGDFVGQGNDSPGTFATLAHDVYDGSLASAGLATSSDTMHKEVEEEEQDEDEEEEEFEEEEEDDPRKALTALSERLTSSVKRLQTLNGKTFDFSFAIPAGIIGGRDRPSHTKKRSSSESAWVQWDDARLTAVLEQMIDAPRIKQDGNAPALGGDVEGTTLDNKTTSSDARPAASSRATIVHVQDLERVCSSRLGSVVVARLAKLIQKRRRLGEKIVLVGTGSNAEPIISDDLRFIPFSVPTESESTAFGKTMTPKAVTKDEFEALDQYRRIANINMRHITSMLRRLQPHVTYQTLLEIPQTWLLAFGSELLIREAQPQYIIHGLSLIAIGIAIRQTGHETVLPHHIALAAVSVARSMQFGYWRHSKRPKMSLRDIIERSKARLSDKLKAHVIDIDPDTAKAEVSERLDTIKEKCNSYEKRLLSGVVDAQNIKVGFEDVHVAPETIEALKNLTSLSLLRPDAFKYGILAKDNLSGLMLYGPPGTGKTLLAKAVAKESKATVLEVSGAQIYEKYVGEGEKMVQAVFTLAKKLSPCIVFIDEADALFGSRSSAGNRNTHRELINQFLREWDGMDDHKVFIMVATNRPFDVDDAVLRRLPRRLLVDLPVTKDRENILGIHLRDEAIDSSVTLSALAEKTPLYSGSDLKNLCVSAALAAVREENDLSAKHADDKDFSLPEKRTLHQRHFDKGLQDISASISEDMSSLTALRKFDEQYGDRKGRRKKASYGFGAANTAVDEQAARIRQGP